MKQRLALNAFATATLAIALPLTANANSEAQEQAFERLNQPTASQSAQATNAETLRTTANVGGGHSAAMSDALKRTNANDTSDRSQRETASANLDWSGDSEAATDALRRVNQPDAS